MPRSSCDVCCKPQELARGVDSYRAAMLRILCAMLEGQAPAGAVATPIGSFQAEVTSAGSAENLAANPCRSCTIKALANNDDVIYVGAASVDSSTGFVLSPGDSVSMDINNTNLVYIDSVTSGDGVSVIWIL